MKENPIREKIPFWEEISANLRVGDVLKGRVSRKELWGTYVDFEVEGAPKLISGLITLPYMHDFPDAMVSTKDQLVIGQELIAVVFSIDRYGGVMLSIRKSHIDNPKLLTKTSM